MNNVTVTTTPEGGRQIVIDIAAERVAIIKYSNRSFTDVATSVVGEIEAKNLAIVMNDATAKYKTEFEVGNVDGTLCGLGRNTDLLNWFMTRPEYESIIDREVRVAAEMIAKAEVVAALLKTAEDVVTSTEVALEQ